MALSKDEQISSDRYLAESQQRIADATIAEILKNGVLGLRLAVVAKNAGVSTPLIYKYFGNRENLIAEVLGNRIESDYLAEIQQMIAKASTTTGDVDINLFFEFLAKPEDSWRFERRWLRLEAKAASRRIPQLQDRLKRSMNIIESASAEQIEAVRRQTGNRSTVPARTLAWMFIAFTDGFTNRDFDPESVNNESYRQLVVSILKQHVF